MVPKHGRCRSLDTHHTTSLRLETLPSRPPHRMDVHSFRRGPLAKPEQAAWCAASRLFRETPQNLADRVLQPADRGLQLAFRLVGAAFGLLLVRLCGPIVGCRSRPQLWHPNS